jgi:hypothetical protein
LLVLFFSAAVALHLMEKLVNPSARFAAIIFLAVTAFHLTESSLDHFFGFLLLAFIWRRQKSGFWVNFSPTPQPETMRPT